MNHFIHLLCLTLLATTKDITGQLISPTLSSTQTVVSSTVATQPPISPPTQAPTQAPNSDACLPTSPCLNGATCIPFQGTYSCTCAPGFEGTNCEIAGTFSVQVEMTLLRFVDRGIVYDQFPAALSTSDSIEYQNLCRSLQVRIKEIVYSKWTNQFITSYCDGFRSGSIIAIFTVEMTKSFSDSITSIQNEIVVQASQTGGWFNETTTKVEIIPSSVTAADFNECTTARNGYCQKSATCVNTQGSFQCTCDSGYTLTNSACALNVQPESNDTLFIALGVVGGLLGILCGSICCFMLLAARKRRKRHNDEEKWSNSDSSNFWDFTSPKGRVVALPNEPLMRARLKQQELARDRRDWDLGNDHRRR